MRKAALALLRHGTAEPESLLVSDRARRLTDVGREEVARTAAAFAQAELRVRAAFCSPYPRAHETAEIFLSRVEHAPSLDLVQDERLVPEAHVGSTARWASEEASSRRLETAPSEEADAQREVVLFAAHEPILSQLAGRLIGHRRRALERAELIVLGWDGAAWVERSTYRG